jgi:3-hydroxyisobutyrate dehydrogenase
VGLIGLGNMGRPMAQTLKKAGFKVLGFDLNPANRAQLAGEIDVLDDAGELCRRCKIVLLSLPSSREVEQVSREVFLPQAAPNSLLIDFSTADPQSSRILHAELQQAGHAMLDAPVSGGPAGAAASSLLIMVGGELNALEQARPLLQALASKIVHCGGAGAGNVVKLIGNTLCASHLALVGEALALGDANQIAPDTLLEALNAGSGQSRVSELHVPRWVLSETFNSGFTMGLMRKDLGLAQGLAEQLNTPITQSMVNIWRETPLSDQDDFTRLTQAIREAGHAD